MGPRKRGDEASVLYASSKGLNIQREVSSGNWILPRRLQANGCSSTCFYRTM
jgi:hypothetical protein